MNYGKGSGIRLNNLLIMLRAHARDDYGVRKHVSAMDQIPRLVAGLRRALWLHLTRHAQASQKAICQVESTWGSHGISVKSTVKSIRDQFGGREYTQITAPAKGDTLRYNLHAEKISTWLGSALSTAAPTAQCTWVCAHPRDDHRTCPPWGRHLYHSLSIAVRRLNSP